MQILVYLYGKKLKLKKMPDNKEKNIKFKLGFSMIEMMVSVAIILLVGSMFLANYRSGIRRSDLSMTTSILAADTRLAQSYSLGLMKYDNVFPDGGWGIAFDLNHRDRYFFFADGYLDPANYNMEANEALPQYKGKTTILPQGIIIQSVEIKVNGASSFPTKSTITFTPPDPRTVIYAVDSAKKGEEILVTLKNTYDNSTMKMLVNFVGLVDTLQ